MKTRCLLLILLVNILACTLADETKSHKLVKRQFPPRPGGQRAFPLSRSRQFPPPEELEESDEYVNSEDEEEDKSAASPFRGRQPQRPPVEDDSEDYSYTEAPKKTSPAPQKTTARTVIFNNRFAGRPRFGQSSTASTTTTTTAVPKPASTSRSRFRATPAQSQRLDVIANILNKPPPPRPTERSSTLSRTRPSPASSTEAPTRRSSNNRPRGRGRIRARTSSTTTTTTTTTTEQPLEEYYYYYEDDEDNQKNQPIATTTSTTTTTTPKPSLPKRVSIARRPSGGRSQSTSSQANRPSKPVIKFDPESQFVPPPEDIAEVLTSPSSTKKFTTSTTTPLPPGDSGAIPPHLRSKYRPRTDGRFIDFLRDPNRPRELKGFDLTDYPFYIKVPEDIDFECDDKKDGYYASVPHKCQLFHYCFAGARYDFLCANYTLYDQTTFTCRFANNVDCESSAKYYYRNDDLWKETTTVAPETTTPKRRRTTPRDEDYDDEYDYDEYDDEEEEERRRPPKRRRNRRKNRRKPQE